MKTDAVDMRMFIPLFMRDDPSVEAMAEAVNDIMSTADPSKLRTWDQLDKMTHEELDALADELNVLWYNAAGTLEQKREQIKTSDDVWRTLGTRYAVETVISQIFGNGELREFWEYEGGKPHHFRVDVSDPSVLTPAGEKEFRRILELVKRKSQILDSIRLVLDHQFKAFAGCAVLESSIETVRLMGQPETKFIGPYTFAGIVISEATREVHGFPSRNGTEYPPFTPIIPPDSDEEVPEPEAVAIVSKAIAGIAVVCNDAGATVTDRAIVGDAIVGYAVSCRKPGAEIIDTAIVGESVVGYAVSGRSPTLIPIASEFS